MPICSHLSDLRLYLGHAPAMFSLHSCSLWPCCDGKMGCNPFVMYEILFAFVGCSLSSFHCAFYSAANLTFPRSVPKLTKIFFLLASFTVASQNGMFRVRSCLTMPFNLPDLGPPLF